MITKKEKKNKRKVLFRTKFCRVVKKKIKTKSKVKLKKPNLPLTLKKKKHIFVLKKKMSDLFILTTILKKFLNLQLKQVPLQDPFFFF